MQRLALAPEKFLLNAAVTVESAPTLTGSKDGKGRKAPWRQVFFHKSKEGTQQSYDANLHACSHSIAGGATPRVEVGQQRQVGSKNKMNSWNDWRVVLMQ